MRISAQAIVQHRSSSYQMTDAYPPLMASISSGNNHLQASNKSGTIRSWWCVKNAKLADSPIDQLHTAWVAEIL